MGKYVEYTMKNNCYAYNSGTDVMSSFAFVTIRRENNRFADVHDQIYCNIINKS